MTLDVGLAAEDIAPPRLNAAELLRDVALDRVHEIAVWEAA